MFGKARQWLTARLGSKQQDPLRLFVHRHPMYQSVWQPIVTPDKQPGLQIQLPRGQQHGGRRLLDRGCRDR